MYIHNVTGTYDPNLNTYAVMDAVFAFAYALKTWHKAVCPNDLNVCKKLRDANTEELMPYLLNVTFKGMLSSKLGACWFKCTSHCLISVQQIHLVLDHTGTIHLKPHDRLKLSRSFTMEIKMPFKPSHIATQRSMQNVRMNFV